MAVEIDYQDAVFKVLEEKRQTKKASIHSEDILTRIDNIEDKIDCLQRHVTLSCASQAEFKKLILDILREERLRRMNHSF